MLQASVCNIRVKIAIDRKLSAELGFWSLELGISLAFTIESARRRIRQKSKRITTMNELTNSKRPLVVSRRDFLKNSSKAVAGSALLSSLAVERFAHGAISPSDTVRVALIGCGGRGTGAANQALGTQGPIKLVAVADAFKEQTNRALNQLKAHKDKLDVPEEHKFVGFDAYKQAIQLADVVILATP